jgi:hypothetical protein
MFILDSDFFHPKSQIQDLGSHNNKNKRGGGIYCLTFFYSHTFHIIWSFDKDFMYLQPKILLLSSQKYGLGIRDRSSRIKFPRSRIRKRLILDPEPGVKKSTGSGYATEEKESDFLNIFTFQLDLNKVV